MGYTLAKDLQEKVEKLVCSKDWDPEQATPIPDADGFVLVKHGTQAFHERMADRSIFKIPVSIQRISSGAKVNVLCYVCTK